MLKELIRISKEVYVDDLLVKSMEEANHIKHLAKAFSILRKFQMKLNPTKCVFGVSFGKFLGHLISQRGIEANLEKIQAVINMPTPQMTKEVQSLARRVIALNRLDRKSTRLNSSH